MELFLITTTLKFITSLSNSSPELFGLVNWEKEALGTRLLVHDKVRHGLLQIATGITEIAMNLRGKLQQGLQIATAPQILLPLFCGYSR